MGRASRDWMIYSIYFFSFFLSFWPRSTNGATVCVKIFELGLKKFPAEPAFARAYLDHACVFVVCCDDPQPYIPRADSTWPRAPRRAGSLSASWPAPTPTQTLLPQHPQQQQPRQQQQQQLRPLRARRATCGSGSRPTRPCTAICARCSSSRSGAPPRARPSLPTTLSVTMWCVRLPAVSFLFVS